MPDEPVFPPAATPVPPGSPPPPPYQTAMPPVGTSGPDLGTTTGLPPNVAAGLAVLFSLLSGVVFLVLEKRSHFVRFWAMQSVIVGAALFLFNIGTWILGVIFAHIPVLGWIGTIFLFLLSLAVGVGALVLYIIMLVKAFTGVEWNVPVIGKFARQQLARLPL